MKEQIKSKLEINKFSSDNYAKQDNICSQLTKRKSAAFTLAEVLITLGIIGVVAALTMPVLIQKHQEQVTVNKLKKFYSTFSQAYLMAINENGTIDNWGLGNSQMTQNEDGDSVHSAESLSNYEKFFNVIGKYLKIIKFEKDTNKGTMSCRLADGTQIVAMWLNNVNCINKQKCGDFYVYTGNKYNSNTELGTDKQVFAFNIYKNVILPYGNTDDTFINCKNQTNYTRCTAWVLYNRNMDYLHCPDELSWNGKTKCGKN